MKDHIVKSDDNEYEITFHPAFASRCTVSGKGGKERELFKQTGIHQLNGKAIPKKHTIRLKSKGGKRDISITLDDAAHSVAKIKVELYDDSHDPTTALSAGSTDTVFTVENNARICPPICGE